MDFAKALFEVFLVDEGYGLEMQVEVGDERVWEDGEAVVFAFSIAHDDLMVAEVNILDAQAKTFHQPESGAVEEPGHELGYAVHFFDDGDGFVVGEDRWEGF